MTALGKYMNLQEETNVFLKNEITDLKYNIGQIKDILNDINENLNKINTQLNYICNTDERSGNEDYSDESRVIFN